jgi:beta-N-acetylhexosaminidase
MSHVKFFELLKKCRQAHRRVWTVLPLLTLAALILVSANNYRPHNFNYAFDAREAAWVDSVFHRLSETERIGQLILVRAHTDRDTAFENAVERQIKQYKVGGICFFNPSHAGTPEKQAVLTNRYQAAANLPLFVSLDAEWGLGMRLRNGAISYPRQMMLGAIQDNRLIYDMGREIAQQCRRIGVNVSFSPVADVNNNPANPVINDRSFGEDRYNVAAKCFQYMMGLQDGGVLACAKHFPGHGDTNIDSHDDLPVIAYPKERLDSLELFPFRVLSQYGVGSFMVAHLNVPAIDNRAKRPTSLSRNTITGLLRDNIGFDGLIFTDGMEMRGVTKYFEPGQADVEAIRAGIDMILLPENVDAAVSAIQHALNDGTLSREQFEASVQRVLRAKYRLKLTEKDRVELANLSRDLNRPEALMTKRKLIAQALTLVRDRPGLVGFEALEKFGFATLALGDTNRTVFQNSCALFAPVQHFNADKTFALETEQKLLDTLRKFDVVLLGLHNMRSYAAANFGLTDAQINLVRKLSEKTTVALTVFGNPYSLRHFDDVPIVLEAYNEDPVTQELAAQALFGAGDLTGKLPVTASPSAKYGQGVQKIFAQKRLGYDLPEAVGLNSDTLRLLDTLIRQLIATGAAPGGQLLVAKDNRIVVHKAYGHHTYERTTPVKLDDLFDLASITKVAATTVSVMRLQDEGKIRLDSNMQVYVPDLKMTNKNGLKVREIMAHHAALQAWIPFYQNTLTPEKQPAPALYRHNAEHNFEVPVAKGLYMARQYVDTMWKILFTSELRPDKKYKYSDLGLYLCARAVQNQSGRRVDAFAEETYYKPLGMATTTYNPWKRGWAERCAPSEEDRYFRYERVQGYVHDMGAAMLGGVSGHAGLFSSANDLAKLFQMLLNGGSYFGKTYLQYETIKEYATRFPGSTRRGIGFDMKELDPKETQNLSPLAGPNTFGHTGFTGTCVWADPDKNLIFIFFSNRTYPTMENGKLISGDYRPRMQSVIYRALKNNR